MLLGIALVAAVFVLDRLWINNSTWCWPASRPWSVVVGLAAVGWALSHPPPRTHPLPAGRGSGDPLPVGLPYLRITDILRNPVYVMMLAMLGIILVAGQVAGGSQRWLGAGTIQPSELAKIMIIVVLAKFLADREEELEKFYHRPHVPGHRRHPDVADLPAA